MAASSQEKIPVKEKYGADEVSKEDKSKQTAAVEKLIKDTITKNIPDYSDKVFAVGGFVRESVVE